MSLIGARLLRFRLFLARRLMLVRLLLLRTWLALRVCRLFSCVLRLLVHRLFRLLLFLLLTLGRLLSVVLLLAYGFARPVIIYPAGGMVEAVVDGETGWICSDSSVEALAAALLDSARVGHEECARRGQRGRELANERFSWPVIARRTGALYEEVLGGV